jgi:hypothetical protein
MFIIILNIFGNILNFSYFNLTSELQKFFLTVHVFRAMKQYYVRICMHSVVGGGGGGGGGGKNVGEL